jgi:alpha-N-arabinofuranosidase
VIPGFYPDPSVVRVGEDYYLATSTFEYFPGVPIFHSRDLVHWRQIGHALTRPSQVPLTQAQSSGGIYAPTLRHSNGTFYLITTNISGGGNFFVTTRDPAGEWSERTLIAGDTSSGGIDPSLFFDDDGKVYFTRHGGGERGGIYQAEINISTGRLAAQPSLVWAGTGNIWPEGPHLYKINGTYYLMIAEGGTGTGHRETIARATSPMGPYEAYAGNPILTHANQNQLPIKATGHADLVQLPDGTFWMVFLGIRQWDGMHQHLGRETFLAPVTWNAAGWPVVNGGRPIALEMSTAGLPPQQAPAQLLTRDDFAATRLALPWNFLRNPSASSWSLSARPGFLRLSGTRTSLDLVGSPAWVGRRQQHFRVRVSASLEFRPDAAGQEAGLTIRANENYHYDLAVTRVGSERRVQLRTRVAGATTVVSDSAVPDGTVTLIIDAREDRYDFSIAAPSTAAPRSLGTAPTVPLSSEVAGGFTGVYFGMYAFAGNADTMPPADFDWFDYQPSN